MKKLVSLFTTSLVALFATSVVACGNPAATETQAQAAYQHYEEYAMQDLDTWFHISPTVMLYQNSRFGHILQIPAAYEIGEMPMNGDGRVFTSVLNDQIQIATYATFSPGDTLEDYPHETYLDMGVEAKIRYHEADGVKRAEVAAMFHGVKYVISVQSPDYLWEDYVDHFSEIINTFYLHPMIPAS